MTKVTFTSDFPYTSINININDDIFLIQNPTFPNVMPIYAQDVFSTYAKSLIEKQEFEVLYFGQAYGKEGDRTAFNRLSSHSTLQKILTDCQTKYPNKHIYLLLLEITPITISTFNGISKSFQKSEDESEEHMQTVLSTPLAEQQIINISEAALINYFKPEYNTNFVENFPDKNHKGYMQYYNLDYNCITFELDLEFDTTPWIQLYSKYNRIDTSWDFIQYNLHNIKERRNMYDIFEK